MKPAELPPYFLAQRTAILASWPGGVEIDLAEACAYHHQTLPHRRFPLVLTRAARERRVLAQPRGGVALLEQQIDLLQWLEKDGGADCLPVTIDSYTRQCKFGEAEAALVESRQVGRSMLNGFPAVSHGVRGCRSLIECVALPVQIRHGSPDARVLAEVSFAGGMTSFEGGGITYNIPYARAVPLERSLRDWQYVDRLVHVYGREGVVINRESFGALTGTLVPPCIAVSIVILEALLAAEQGVRSLTLGYGQLGHLVQDVAALVTLRKLAAWYLERFEYEGAEISTVLYQWMGAFPQDPNKACGVIAWGAATAALGGATKVIVKSPQEARGVPTREANAAGVRTTQQILGMLRQQDFTANPAVLEEAALIEAEVRAIVERVLSLCPGDLVQSVSDAFKAGVLDVPFSPSNQTMGRVLPARDETGAVRILSFGHLPLPDDIKIFHRGRLAERANRQRRPVQFEMVIDDVYAVARGRLTGEPPEPFVDEAFTEAMHPGTNGEPRDRP